MNPIIYQKIFEQALSNYFSKKYISCDLTNLIHKIINGTCTEQIIAQYNQNLSIREMQALKQIFKTEQFQHLQSKYAHLKLLVQSSQKKNLYLINFLLQQSSTDYNVEFTMLEDYLRASIEEQQICQEILKKYQTKYQLKQTKIIKQQSLELVKKEVQNFLSGFISGNLLLLNNLIITLKPLEQQLQKQMNTWQFNKLLSWISSTDFIIIKQKLHAASSQIKNEEFSQIREELHQLFKAIKFDTTNLINSIIQQCSLQQIIADLQESVKAKEYKKLLHLIESQEFKKIRLNLQNKKRQIHQKKCKKTQLIEICKGIKGFSNKLIEYILNADLKNQNLQLQVLEDELTGKQFRLLKTFLDSQTMNIYRTSLNPSLINQSKNKPVQRIQEMIQYEVMQQFINIEQLYHEKEQLKKAPQDNIGNIDKIKSYFNVICGNNQLAKTNYVSSKDAIANIFASIFKKMSRKQNDLQQITRRIEAYQLFIEDDQQEKNIELYEFQTQQMKQFLHYFQEKHLAILGQCKKQLISQAFKYADLKTLQFLIKLPGFCPIIFSVDYVFHLIQTRKFKLFQLLWSYEQRRQNICKYKLNDKTILEVAAQNRGLSHNFIDIIWRSNLFKTMPLIKNQKSKLIIDNRFNL